MLRLGNPEHGWMTLTVGNDGNSYCFDISDVGPNTLLQLQSILLWLESPTDKHIVEANLEPDCLSLSFSMEEDSVQLEIMVNNETLDIYHILASDLKHRIYEELKRVIPLCHGANWTQIVG